MSAQAPHDEGRSPGRVAHQDDSAGSASVELIIIFPALLALIFITAQAGLYYFARSVALAAAQEGARAGSASNAAPGVAQSQAHTYLIETAPDLLQSPTVSARQTASDTTVTVTGTSLSLVPGYRGIPISQSAAAPNERVTG